MKRHLEIAIAALFVTAPAMACGPYFPETLLDDRAGTLEHLPEGTFAYEAAHLVPAPTPAFKPVEQADWFWSEEPPVTREVAERSLLGTDYEQAQSVRHSVNATEAYTAGEGLPEDARRYLAGAVAFQTGDLAEAAHRFASVLDLPVSERARYGVWAAYMRARSEAASDTAAAAKSFQQVRALVAAGAADPLGMALGSYGEEARLRLAAGDDAGAIALYALQTASGSKFGEGSLLQVARALVADPQRLERGIADPLTQRLTAAYMLTRSNELYDQAGSASDSVIENFLGAIERRGLDHVQGADRLAALAYRNGQYDLAAKLAEKGTGGLAAWVRAKLALRAGDANAAAAAYVDAAKAFPLESGSIHYKVDFMDPPNFYCRVEGEAGTLALERGEFVTALEHLYAAKQSYWPDAAYVAERVLSVDELKHFVDSRAIAVVDSVEDDTDLRALLARRLLRAERYDESLVYFDQAELKGKASEYVVARRAAESGGRIERAEQWYRAATIAYEDGMELLGYEFGPDNRYIGGSYGYFRDFAPKSSTAASTFGPDAGERERAAATRAQPDKRFHYRYVAAEFAARAAELVPSRSQAYAANLCLAASWVLLRDPEAARVYYARYVKHGPHVAWAADFGTQCEQPDFAAAARRLHAERVAAAKRFARKALPYALGIGALGVAGIVLWRRRRRP